MTIKSICNTKVVTVLKIATLDEVSKLMQKHHVGSVVITETFNGLRIPAGIITDRDIALVVGSSQKPKAIRVEQIIQSQPITVKESAGIYEAIIIMRKNGVKRLPVVNEDGSLYGIVSADDILNLMGEEISNLARINEMQIRHEQGINLPPERHL